MGDNSEKGKMRFLFVVTSNPFAKDFSTLLYLVSALSKEGEVVMFFSGNGAYYLTRPEAKKFKDAGARLLYCAHSAHQRGVEKVPDFFESSSTYNLSKMLPEYDKVLVFN
ncbi:MAG: DsrE family protein [Hydrogenobacter sp.]|uniref:DsrE family protein n=1 Tax=Hydrogenobacter thermophilus TaxID=940 RepID=UPI0030F98601